MTSHDYWAERGKLGEALRHLRWERRAIADIFRHTKDPDIISRGSEWLRQIHARDIALCQRILALDVRYQLDKER